MTLHPRRLRLLIIDDELTLSPGGYDVPDTIKRLSPVEHIFGIDSWRTAIQFWSDFKGGEAPDVVVADVRFIRDLDSPLAKLFKAEDNNIPTGLSHLKTFAVLARARRQPMGVSIRTMDESRWEEQIKSERPQDRAMGYLAVQEIGELMAILGDGPDLISRSINANGSFNRDRAIESCFAWFHRKCAKPFEDGLRQAISDYRRRLHQLTTSSDLPSIFVRPSHYSQLMGWCQLMSQNPKPLDDDFGLELIYGDGRQDLISLSSLFSDYGSIRTKTLSPAAFATESRTEPWKFDDDGRPRIGAFLRSLGSLTRACEAAADTLRTYYAVDYPTAEDYRPRKLSQIKDKLTAGLVVVFQFVRIEQKRRETWEESFAGDLWDAKRLQFVQTGKSPTRTLQHALLTLINLARGYLAEVGSDEATDSLHTPQKAFTRAELFDGITGEWVAPVDLDRDASAADRDWVKWHFERLVDAGAFLCHIRNGEESYSLSPAWQKHRSDLVAPPVPWDFPEIIEAGDEQKKRKEPERSTWVRNSLGYPTDYNSIERVLAAAFIPAAFRQDDVRLGSQILDELRSTEWRPFLLEAAREYARLIKWPTTEWPRWLQPANDESMPNCEAVKHAGA